MTFWTFTIAFWIVMFLAVAVEIIWKYRSESRAGASPRETGGVPSDLSCQPTGPPNEVMEAYTVSASCSDLVAETVPQPDALSDGIGL
jgi:hypothetical protein